MWEFDLNIPQMNKVIWGQDHRFRSHPTDLGTGFIQASLSKIQGLFKDI